MSAETKHENISQCITQHLPRGPIKSRTDKQFVRYEFYLYGKKLTSFIYKKPDSTAAMISF
jgi:hypothetical protein